MAGVLAVVVVVVMVMVVTLRGQGYPGLDRSNQSWP